MSYMFASQDTTHLLPSLLMVFFTRLTPFLENKIDAKLSALAQPQQYYMWYNSEQITTMLIQLIEKNPAQPQCFYGSFNKSFSGTPSGAGCFPSTVLWCLIYTLSSAVGRSTYSFQWVRDSVESLKEGNILYTCPFQGTAKLLHIQGKTKRT